MNLVPKASKLKELYDLLERDVNRSSSGETLNFISPISLFLFRSDCSTNLKVLSYRKTTEEKISV